MQKNQAYHEACIEYNEGIADAAEKLAPTLGHEEPQRWCRSVAKQHRFHAKRHQSALDKLKAQAEDPEKMDLSVAGETEPLATIEVSDETTEIIEEAPERVLADGCAPYHDPNRPECDFSPNKEAANG
jgi:hypothetical protein